MSLDADEYADLCADTRQDPDFEIRRLIVESPTAKAKRIESLRARCAGLIHKSQVYLHLTDERSHSLKMRRQAKLKRQRDRAAARLALEKLEKSIQVYDPLAAMREYEMLISSNAPYRKLDWHQFLQSSGISIK
ncbi:hypothetical protein MKW92_022946 [Papaver armeniacum]|nr:hypothetical protein MKW92_041958 [Papaver armeniacum]KAI3943339.1 hypothetical protein MKW92_038909 [Papaver armeniacum]KAI3966577.1 hypothetical protein MKW92_022946 [Papaver armeniacum]